MTWTYNVLKGEARKWAQENKVPTSEKCTRVVGGKHMGKFGDSLSRVAGNGLHGFSSRRQRQDPVKMTVGLDGQYKKDRKTVVRRRKNVCRLWNQSQIRKAQMDSTDKFVAFLAETPHLLAKRIVKKAARRRNRNHRARRGHKKCLHSK